MFEITVFIYNENTISSKYKKKTQILTIVFVKMVSKIILVNVNEKYILCSHVNDRLLYLFPNGGRVAGFWKFINRNVNFSR